jgi:hypothetical protein
LKLTDPKHFLKVVTPIPPPNFFLAIRTLTEGTRYSEKEILYRDRGLLDSEEKLQYRDRLSKNSKEGSLYLD